MCIYFSRLDATAHILADNAGLGLVLGVPFFKALKADAHSASSMKVARSVSFRAQRHLFAADIARVERVLPGVGVCQDRISGGFALQHLHHSLCLDWLMHGSDEAVEAVLLSFDVLHRTKRTFRELYNDVAEVANLVTARSELRAALRNELLNLDHELEESLADVHDALLLR